MIRLLFLGWMGVALCQQPLYAQFRAPKYSNEFLSIGVGARALGMSNAQVAHVDDVTAGYWNPAGLLAITSDYQATLMHAEYFAGMAKYDYLAVALPSDSLSRLAVSVIRFAVDDIPDTRFLYDASGAINYDNIRFFSAADYAFLLSYARKLPLLDGLKVGANAKVVHRVAGKFANAWGFGLDAGAQLQRGPWQYGLMLRDITGTFNAWSHNAEMVEDIYNQTGNEIPQNSVEVTLPKAIAGLARLFEFGDSWSLLTAMDLAFTFDGKRNVAIRGKFTSIDPVVGLETGYKRTAFLRLGGGNVQRIKDFDGSYYTVWQPNFGLGFKLKNASIDYSLTDIGDQSESLYSHVFSLKFSLDK
jgi:hypothetical protein